MRKKPCRCRYLRFSLSLSQFNPSLCSLSPFLLSYVTVSRPCNVEIYPNRASLMCIKGDKQKIHATLTKRKKLAPNWTSSFGATPSITSLTVICYPWQVNIYTCTTTGRPKKPFKALWCKMWSHTFAAFYNSHSQLYSSDGRNVSSNKEVCTFWLQKSMVTLKKRWGMYNNWNYYPVGFLWSEQLKMLSYSTYPFSLWSTLSISAVTSAISALRRCNKLVKNIVRKAIT